ncbi:hypothetical protein MNBD_CHLOROFLEXI01-35, partial [hydrothermal vent metagenome]
KMFQYGALMKAGRHDFPGMTMVNGRSITIHTTPTMPCQTDGEPGGHTPFTCEIKPNGLRLLVPPTAPDDLFQQAGISLNEYF